MAQRHAAAQPTTARLPWAGIAHTEMPRPPSTFSAPRDAFLHFRHGRDDNTLDWQSQDEAAAQSIGLETRGTADPAYWMRTYYRHARTVYRRAVPAHVSSFLPRSASTSSFASAERRFKAPTSCSTRAASMLRPTLSFQIRTAFCASSP